LTVIHIRNFGTKVTKRRPNLGLERNYCKDQNSATRVLCVSVVTF